MLALQPVEADPRRLDAPHGRSDVAQLRRIEVDRVIRRRAESATVQALGCRIGAAKTGVAGVSPSCAVRASRIAAIVPASSCFAEFVPPKPLPFNAAQPLGRAPRLNRPRALRPQAARANAVCNEFPCGARSDRYPLVTRTPLRRTEMSETRRKRTASDGSRALANSAYVFATASISAPPVGTELVSAS